MIESLHSRPALASLLLSIAACASPPPVPVILASGQALPFAIAVDAQNVYWANQEGVNQPGAIVKMSRSGGEPVTLAVGPISPFALAITADSVLCASFGTLDFNVMAATPSTNPSIVQIPMGGGTPVTLARL